MSERMRTRWLNFAVTATAPVRRASRRGGRTGADDRATLVIDKQDTVVDDLDRDCAPAWGDDVLSFR